MYDLEKLDKRKFVFGNIFLLSNRLQTVMDRTTDELTAKQWFVLMVLEMFEEPPTLKMLADMYDSSHQNIKQLVLKLEKKGFVRVEDDPTDRRTMRIVATAKCQQWDEENKAITEDFLNRMFNHLTAEEIETLRTVQQKIYTNLGNMKEH
ncbi:MarR family winged helix-turn-helix transcriptional regulator [Oscillospiraceae bacterium LTW-04]|nr:MarR family transcriptional regulator [Oscillospiraceae bacterium MB24-C1]